MPIKAIFFDTSDTLYHNRDFKKAQSRQPILQLAEYKDISFKHAQEVFDKTKQQLKSKMIHVPKVAVMMQLGISRLEMQRSLSSIKAKRFLRPDPKLNTIIRELRQKYQLGIITNILKIFLIDILGALELDKSLFEYFVTVDNTLNSKPHQEPFLKAIELTGLKPCELVYVGDSLTKDIIPGKKAGFKTIWVTQDPKPNDNVDVHIPSVHKVKSALSHLN